MEQCIGHATGIDMEVPVWTTYMFRPGRAAVREAHEFCSPRQQAWAWASMISADDADRADTVVAMTSSPVVVPLARSEATTVVTCLRDSN